ncbi:hypothetical protein E2562_016494 [Oryza meyeriana var. granulata]|uniref:Uncharacterized protein n=1 Tax=Oryza meyeriana var. granulata TaxID=110450 RepID=A0A6G1BKX3_9ORYZ|nr:hypothetical protein E2562_016494 [Oryza meyeriana var. granulata]
MSSPAASLLPCCPLTRGGWVWRPQTWRAGIWRREAVGGGAFLLKGGGHQGGGEGVVTVEGQEIGEIVAGGGQEGKVAADGCKVVWLRHGSGHGWWLGEDERGEDGGGGSRPSPLGGGSTANGEAEGGRRGVEEVECHEGLVGCGSRRGGGRSDECTGRGERADEFC